MLCYVILIDFFDNLKKSKNFLWIIFYRVYLCVTNIMTIGYSTGYISLVALNMSSRSFFYLFMPVVCDTTIVFSKINLDKKTFEKLKPYIQLETTSVHQIS